MKLFYFLLLLLFIYRVQSSFNLNPTYSKLGLSNLNGTSVQISPQQDMVIVGFSDGTIKIFDLALNQICSGSSNNVSDISSIIWLPNFGPVSLDLNNTVTLWTTQCEITNTLSFNQTILTINFNQITDQDNDTTIGLIALNFKHRIQQYNIQSGDLNLVYDIPDGQDCLQIIYNPDGQDTVLLATTNLSMIRKFQIDNGTQLQAYDISSPVKSMEKISVATGDVVIGITRNNHVVRFDSAGQILDRGVYQQANSIAICPSTKQFALAYATNKKVGIYLYSGQQQQSITSLNSFAQDVDCSTSYLVTIDDLGYINVYTYEQFKSWIIGLIAGIAGGLVGVVIGVIIFINIKKKFALQAANKTQSNGKPKKYPRSKNTSAKKQQSMKMLKLSTMDTSMR